MTSKFGVDYAKRVAKCKKCQQQLLKGDLRMWRMVPNPFTADSGNPTEMKNYFHPECLFETLMRCRATTKVIDSPDDIEGWDAMTDEDKENIIQKIKNLAEVRSKKFGDKIKHSTTLAQKDISKPSVSKDTLCEDGSEKGKKSIDSKKKKGKTEVTKKKAERGSSKKIREGKQQGSVRLIESEKTVDESRTIESNKSNAREERSKFDNFKLFCKLCDVIGSVSKYSEKSAAVRIFINKEGYSGDLYLLLKFLIPAADQRVYNLKAKQIIKIFAGLFDRPTDELMESYNQTGDVSQTVCDFLSKSNDKSKKSKLTNQMVDDWLEQLCGLSREEEQQDHFTKICELATCLELKYIIRLIMKDLRINAGAKHILEGVRKGAYEVFQSSQNLQLVIEKYQKTDVGDSVSLEGGIVLNTPVKPMLAEPCRNIDEAMKKCNKEMYAEIKYDGERLQLHKDDDRFTFFSRSLKPTLDHKVVDLDKVVAEAFPTCRNLIVDAEMLLVDNNTGKPLPFGTMGIHKKKQFTDASVCLFVFDCLYYDDKTLLEKTLRERRKFLENNMKEVPNRVLLSNSHLVKKGENERLKMLIWKAIDEGLEGLVLKDLDSLYEPGKRHWLKVKKDYLEDGSMTDTADLIVLGAYYGTGNKGGMMSVFLMGVYDENKEKFYTVTKCGNGHDDATLALINKELKPKMIKISRAFENLPNWIECSRPLVPDFIINNPKESPVWEIAGAEFSRSDNHTAEGISIRFPRVTKIRDDKNWETATSLQELKKLYESSKVKSHAESEIESAVPLYAKDKLNEPENFSKASVSKKRKREELDENPESNQYTVESDMDDSKEAKMKKAKKPCKYGEQCYRKNPEHRKQFSHAS